jgi:hypothetical protein
MELELASHWIGQHNQGRPLRAAHCAPKGMHLARASMHGFAVQRAGLSVKRTPKHPLHGRVVVRATFASLSICDLWLNLFSVRESSSLFDLAIAKAG